MEVNLKFNLPEEESTYRHTMAGPDYFCILSEVDTWLRNIIKYNETYSEDALATFAACRSKIYELLEDRGLSLYV